MFSALTYLLFILLPLCWHGVNRLIVQYVFSLLKNDFQLTGRRFNTVGSAFEVDDDTAILFETRDDLAVYSPLLITHFDKFGMEIHAGDYDNSNKPSKTEVLFVSKPPKSYTDPSTYDNADLTNIDILEIESFFQLLINSAILVGS